MMVSKFGISFSRGLNFPGEPCQSRLRALRHAVSRALDAAAAANLTGEGVPAGKNVGGAFPLLVDG